MDPASTAAARSLLPPGFPPTIYADWAASALPLPCTPPAAPLFLPPAHSAHGLMRSARRALGEFLGDQGDNYHVVFTSGATAALQLVAQRLPWKKGVLYCHNHVHNAVLGMRNVALGGGGAFCSLNSQEVEELVTGDVNEDSFAFSATSSCVESGAQKGGTEGNETEGFALFAFSGQCNLTGTKYPLRWACDAKRNGLGGHPAHRVITLVDAAKLAASAPVCLDAHPDIDAMVFSLYKLSASYTGLGALLVRKGSLLERLLCSTAEASYFGGGGSVTAVTPRSMRLFRGGEGLVDALQVGTPNMQAVAGLERELMKFTPSAVVMAKVEKHACEIGVKFAALLSSSFRPELVRIHSDPTFPESPECSVVAFTLYREGKGNAERYPIGHQEIATILSVNNVYARAGCMCNAGACASVLGLTDDDIVANYELGHRCGDGMDLVRGKPTGVVRVSFGWGSMTEDARAIVQILINHVTVTIRYPLRVITSIKKERPERTKVLVDALYLYPVKSCGGQLVTELRGDGRGGAIGDRVFGIEDTTTGELLRLRTCSDLALIRASYSSDWSHLILQCSSDRGGRKVARHISVPLKDSVLNWLFASRELSEGLTGNSCSHTSHNEADYPKHIEIGGVDVTKWLSVVTGRQARLVSIHKPGKPGKVCGQSCNVLIVSKEEINRLEIESGIHDTSLLIAATRPNIVIGCVPDYNSACLKLMTTNWLAAVDNLSAANCSLHHERDCTRCTVVNIVAQMLGTVPQGEPLRSIAHIAKATGKVGLIFGVLAKLLLPSRQNNTDKIAYDDAIVLTASDQFVF